MKNKQLKWYMVALALVVLLPAGGIIAQEARIRFVASVPDEIEVGTAFQLVFELNTAVDQFTGPDFKGFKILAGPGYSESRSSGWVNGKKISEVNVSYAYSLRAINPGKMEIGSATAKIGRNTYKSKPVTVSVYDGGISENASKPLEEGTGDIFILNLITEKNPFKGEVIVLTQKLYTRLSINNIGRIKLPSFNGFWSENIDIGQYNVLQENHQGKLYNTVILNRTLLIPQRSGIITIDPSSIIIQRSVERTVTRQLWGGVIQQKVRELTDHEIIGSSIVIDIKELPSKGKPASFNGAVGSFRIESELSQSNTTVGEPVELKIKITGSGNLKLLQAPVLDLPIGLESFEPETKGKVSPGKTGMRGYREFSFLIISRDTGVFNISGIEFSFFNPASRSYHKEVTPGFFIQSSLGSKSSVIHGQGGQKETVKVLGRDIRHIKTNFSDKPAAGIIPGSILHLMLLLMPLLLLSLYLIYYRKHLKLQADKQKLRYIKAAAMATKRLRQAKLAMEKQDSSLFHELILEALWGYLSDKFNISPALRAKTHLKSKMDTSGIDAREIANTIEIIKNSEFARYAPSGELSPMEETYTRTETCITLLEQQLHTEQKKKKHPRPLLTLLVLLLLSWQMAQAKGADSLFNIANDAYTNGNYALALQVYTDLTNSGSPSSPDLFYNIGNCHYRMGHNADAILWYERALKLKPNDDDIVHNLHFVNNLIKDEIPFHSRMFLMEWWSALSKYFTANVWIIVHLLLFIAALIATAFFLRAKTDTSKRKGFIVAVTMLILSFVTLGLSWQRHYDSHIRKELIVLTKKATVRSGPVEHANKLTDYHAGAKLKVLGQERNWYSIKAHDGQIGWIMKNDGAII